MAAQDLARRIESLQQELDAARARLDSIAHFGRDEYEFGTILTFSKTFINETRRGSYEVRRTAKEYQYAAIKTEAGWSLTGRSQEPKSWDDLIWFITEDGKDVDKSIWRVTQFEEVIA